MANTIITKSMTVNGDIGATFDTVLKKLSAIGFTESSTTWPSDMEVKRGKRGLLAKNLHDVKTMLKVSLKQVSNNVNILFEFNFAVPSSYIDENEAEQEFSKIKHEIIGSTSPHITEKEKVCDVCLNPIATGENFCRNCGRSATRQQVEPSEQSNEELAVMFDPNKVAFGQKMVDDALYGGIPKNGVLLITSPACEEKEIIVTRFVETGLDQSEIVVYVATDNKLGQNEKIIQSKLIYQVICNTQLDLGSLKCATENCVQVRGVERLTELSVTLTTLLNNIEKISGQEKSKRLVIDILSDTLLSNQSVNTRKWLRETITKFKQKNFTILATLNPHMHSKEDVQSLLDLFDGQVEIYEKELQGEPRMFMRVRRLNNSRYSSKEVQLIRENLLIQHN
ncbi:MAG: RAD55 family ATPase [Nitrososphaerota archaeon]